MAISFVAYRSKWIDLSAPRKFPWTKISASHLPWSTVNTTPPCGSRPTCPTEARAFVCEGQEKKKQKRVRKSGEVFKGLTKKTQKPLPEPRSRPKHINLLCLEVRRAMDTYTQITHKHISPSLAENTFLFRSPMGQARGSVTKWSL
ncbi:hypothetical protein AA313_de0206358 [Arthrobotrys entomopaga]|nr:hypothetical protein AA313_de0206358 [Arthrobotrys entomopaga]